ncbi:MAG: hypothetical protein LBV45_06380 [Xanthomonadaceae bacterium]|jgi:hypothetical protein|nr:hypothetical protein [Xanthomonadaceae bacterium]
MAALDDATGIASEVNVLIQDRVGEWYEERVCLNDLSGSRNFLDFRVPERHIATQPLPALVVLDSTVGQLLKVGKTFPNHQFSTFAQVVVSHIKIATIRHSRNQVAADNLAAGVSCGNNSLILAEVKDRLSADFAIS